MVAGITVVDLSFPVHGEWAPADCGYSLYGALCRVIPALHGDDSVGVHPLLGQLVGGRRIKLLPQSRVRLRLPVDRLPDYLELTGRALDVGGARLVLGVPEVVKLRPSPQLTSRLVVIAGYTSPESFLEAAQRQLDALGVLGQIEIPRVHGEVSREGKVSRPAGSYIRRTFTLHGKSVVGFAVHVVGITAEESLLLQTAGIGGRRRFGCGVFVPW